MRRESYSLSAEFLFLVMMSTRSMDLLDEWWISLCSTVSEEDGISYIIKWFFFGTFSTAWTHCVHESWCYSSNKRHHSSVRIDYEMCPPKNFLFKHAILFIPQNKRYSIFFLCSWVDLNWNSMTQACTEKLVIIIISSGWKNVNRWLSCFGL